VPLQDIAIFRVLLVNSKDSLDGCAQGGPQEFWLGGQCPLPPDAKKILKI